MMQPRLRQWLATHTAIRLVVATLLLGLAVVTQDRATEHLAFNPFFVLIGLAFAISLGLLALERFVDRPWMADLHFVLDSLLVTAGVYLTGGVNTLFTPLYALPILSASTVQLRRGGLRMAAVNGSLFAGLVVAQFLAARGVIELPLVPVPGGLPAPSIALYTVGLNVLGFFLVALLAGSLADRVRRADVRVEEVTSEIADLQAFNQFVIDNLLSGLVTADAQNRLLTFNKSAMTITGLSGEPPIGHSATDILQLDPAAVTGVHEELRRRRSKRLDYQFTRGNGTVIDIGLSVARLPLPDGSHGYLYTFQDVTEMKRYERTARMQQRLAAVGEMAAGIAHEIRNPLASMSGSMQMLRQELALTGDQAQLMDIVLRESDRLNQTIKSFLAYARPQKAQLTRLDLGTLVKETALLLRNSPDVGERHTVAVSLSDGEVPVDGDEGQLRQILWNLATNGVRAMRDGGELRLSARREPPNGGPGHAVLEITDHGVGMTPEELDDIFQPFRGSFGQGTGLGLAIVHRIVTDYGGRIDVRSAPGQGTTFAVRFPSPPGEVSAPVTPPPVRSGAGSA
jgi:two-component system, NtrC family, sensor histidine kinase PilS